MTDLAEVGEVMGRRVRGEGCDKVNVALRQFLLLDENKDLFTEPIMTVKVNNPWVRLHYERRFMNQHGGVDKLSGNKVLRRHL